MSFFVCVQSGGCTRKREGRQSFSSTGCILLLTHRPFIDRFHNLILRLFRVLMPRAHALYSYRFSRPCTPLCCIHLYCLLLLAATAAAATVFFLLSSSPPFLLLLLLSSSSITTTAAASTATANHFFLRPLTFLDCHPHAPSLPPSLPLRPYSPARDRASPLHSPFLMPLDIRRIDMRTILRILG